MWPRPQRLHGASGLAAAAVLVVAGACGQGGVPSPVATAPAPTPAPTPTIGPTEYAAWVARQGFGGSSGLANVRKLAVWLGENTATVTAFDLNSDRSDIRALARWLADHPATACWAAYHQAAAADLATLDALYGKALDGIATGAVSMDTARDAIAAAIAAADRPAPANCP